MSNKSEVKRVGRSVFNRILELYPHKAHYEICVKRVHWKIKTIHHTGNNLQQKKSFKRCGNMQQLKEDHKLKGRKSKSRGGETKLGECTTDRAVSTVPRTQTSAVLCQYWFRLQPEPVTGNDPLHLRYYSSISTFKLLLILGMIIWHHECGYWDIYYYTESYCKLITL